MPDPIVLSHRSAQALIQAQTGGERSLPVSLDLGLTTQPVLLAPQGALLPDGQTLPWSAVEAISRDELGCYRVAEGAVERIQAFSSSLNRFYSLMPTTGAPTLLVSGIPMHRIKETDPYQDTLSKIRTLAPLRGQVLDTCTGLGYTAIEAARTAERVITIELDPTVLEVARINPWSRPLFENPRIQQRVGDAYEEIESLDDEAFSRILHDPPTMSLAGELYSGVFYRNLYRVLKRGGRLYHYVGDLESRSGRNVVRGAVRRLQEAGFSRIERKPTAFGLTAFK
jgi:uncharacterized protein